MFEAYIASYNYQLVAMWSINILNLFIMCNINQAKSPIYITAHCPWLGTETSIKSGGVKLTYRPKTSTLSEMMRSCKCHPHVIQLRTFHMTE